MLTHSIKKIGAYFLAGILAVLPLVITVGVVVWAVGFLSDILGPDTFLGKALEGAGLHFAPHGILAYLLGWAIVLGLIFLLGVVLESGAKRFLQGLFDNLIKRIPIMGSIYSTARQLVQMMDKKADTELKAMSVVYCIFGKETGAVFLALMPTPERFRFGEIDYHAILIPSAPVPFGGSMLFVPCDSVHRADMSVDTFMSIYVSMGVTGPQFLPMAPRPV